MKNSLFCSLLANPVTAYLVAEIRWATLLPDIKNTHQSS
jgi:hypothetical protein